LDEKVVGHLSRNRAQRQLYIEEHQVRVSAEDWGSLMWSSFLGKRVFAELPELPRQGCFSLTDHARMSEAPSSMSLESPVGALLREDARVGKDRRSRIDAAEI
jgi:hypothetical protein